MIENNTLEKVIRNGNVAILVSEGYGSGFFTWSDGPNRQALLFHPKLVELVEQGRFDEITEELCEGIVGGYVCMSGVRDLSIHWLPIGTKFRITEFDGYESIEITDYLILTA